MVAKRLAALIAAVALIIGAFVLRRSLDDDKSPASTDPSSPAAPPTAAAAELSVVCVTELAAACDAATATGVAASTQPYADTLAAIASGKRPDVWVTFAPLDRLAVDAGNQRAFADVTAASSLASSPLVIVASTDRATALAATCGTTNLWKCIGDNSGKGWADLGGQSSWGRMLAGHADPSRAAVGLLTLGAASAGYFGNTTFIQNDINDDIGFPDWFGRLERSVPAGVFPLASPLDAILGRKLVSVIGTTEADVDQRAGSQRSSLAITPSGATALAVAATAVDVSIPDDLADAMRRGLTDAGWTPAADSAASDPSATGLPSAGALRTLRDNWSNLQ